MWANLWPAPSAHMVLCLLLSLSTAASWRWTDRPCLNCCNIPLTALCHLKWMTWDKRQLIGCDDIDLHWAHLLLAKLQLQLCRGRRAATSACNFWSKALHNLLHVMHILNSRPHLPKNLQSHYVFHTRTSISLRVRSAAAPSRAALPFTAILHSHAIALHRFVFLRAFSFINWNFFLNAILKRFKSNFDGGLFMEMEIF